MLMSRARLLPGEIVLIHGIGGGVALAALQLASMAGARVIATSSSDEKLMQARDFGADECINYANNPCLAAAVRDLTGGRGADVVVDTVGAATWDINFQAVRRGGRIVHCGVTSGSDAKVDISALYWNQLTVMGSTMGSNEDFAKMLAAVSAKHIAPVIDKTFQLSEIQEATERMEKGLQFGKIVLAIGGRRGELEHAGVMFESRENLFPDIPEISETESGSLS